MACCALRWSPFGDYEGTEVQVAEHSFVRARLKFTGPKKRSAKWMLLNVEILFVARAAVQVPYKCASSATPHVTHLVHVSPHLFQVPPHALQMPRRMLHI